MLLSCTLLASDRIFAHLLSIPGSADIFVLSGTCLKISVLWYPNIKSTVACLQKSLIVLKYILANELEASFIMPVIFLLPVLFALVSALFLSLWWILPSEITFQCTCTCIHSGNHVTIICPYYNQLISK